MFKKKPFSAYASDLRTFRTRVASLRSMNAPLADLAEPPPTLDSIDSTDSLDIPAEATDQLPRLDARSETEQPPLVYDIRASFKEWAEGFVNEEEIPGVDLIKLLEREKQPTKVSLGRVIQLKRGMMEREARQVREVLQNNPADVEELEYQLLVIKMTTDKITDDCYRQISHMLHGLKNAYKYKKPL